MAVPYDEEAITGDNVTVKTLNATKIASGPATRVEITVENAPCRVFVDGTAPTTSLGHEIYAGDEITLDDTTSIDQFQAIATTAVNYTLRATYFSG